VRARPEKPTSASFVPRLPCLSKNPLSLRALWRTALQADGVRSNCLDWNNGVADFLGWCNRAAWQTFRLGSPALQLDLARAAVDGYFYPGNIIRMSNPQPVAPRGSTCTAFAGATRIAASSYLNVALAVRAYVDGDAAACVLIFDDATGKQIDFNLRGSRREIAAQLRKDFPLAEGTYPAPGRPKIGVVAREVTLLPQHWDWLAGQPGGASTTLRRLVDAARRTALSDKQRLRKLQERTYRFMSAIAGNLPHFEEASRALFADNITRFKELIAGWPSDIREHLLKLYGNDATLPLPKRMS